MVNTFWGMIFGLILISTGLQGSESFEDEKGCYYLEGKIIAIYPQTFTESEMIEILSRHKAPENVRAIYIGHVRYHTGEYPITEKMIQYLSDHFPNVTDLGLSGLQVNNRALREISLYFPSLINLNLGIVGPDPLSNTLSIAQAMPRLESLIVDYGPFSDDAVEAFFCYCPNIKDFFYLNGYGSTSSPPCALLTDRCLIAISTYAKNLLELHLYGHLLTWDGVKGILSDSRQHINVVFWHNAFDMPVEEVQALALTHSFTFEWSVE